MIDGNIYNNNNNNLAILGWWGLGTGVTPHNSYGKKKFKYNWYKVYGTRII